MALTRGMIGVCHEPKTQVCVVAVCSRWSKRAQGCQDRCAQSRVVRAPVHLLRGQ